MTTEPPALDVDRLLTTLDRHEVDFVLVGGVAAIAYGARRPTADLDCVARRSSGNLERLAAALRSLNARLRVHGTDEESALLPTRIDKDTLGRMEISTWRTDAGDFDVLTDLPGRDGRRVRYDELIDRSPGRPRHRRSRRRFGRRHRLEGVGRPAEGPRGTRRAEKTRSTGGVTVTGQS